MAKPAKTTTRELEVIETGKGATPGNIVPVALGAQVTNPASAFLQEAKNRAAAPGAVPIIQIDHRAGQFVLPSGELVDSVQGYPVYYFQTRKYYKKPPSPGQKGSPPDCWSADCVVPHIDSLDKQNETCADCPQNQWGTGRDGKSKNCSTPTWLFLLNPELGQVPLAAIVMPPSSIREILGTRFHAGYLSKASARNGAYEVTWTVFRLEQMGDAVVYCVVKPEMGPAATNPDEQRKIASVRNQFIEIMNQMRGLTPTVGGNDEVA